MNHMMNIIVTIKYTKYHIALNPIYLVNNRVFALSYFFIYVIVIHIMTNIFKIYKILFIV